MDKLITVSTGTTLIPLLATLIALSYYLFEQKKRRKANWRQFICFPTPGAQLAMPMIAFKVGVLLSRTTFWFWYYKPVDWLAITTVVVGNLIMVASLMWLVSILTKPKLGNWGWMVTGFLIVLFIASDLEPGN